MIRIKSGSKYFVYATHKDGKEVAVWGNIGSAKNYHATWTAEVDIKKFGGEIELTGSDLEQSQGAPITGAPQN